LISEIVKYSNLKKIYKFLACILLKLKAIVFNKTFACRALNGDSNYNICINSDMTVSCNCQDYDGSGHLGDLTRQDFEDIFLGTKAQGFKAALSRLNFPATNCWACSDFMMLDKTEAKERNSRKKLPTKGIMVENTICCNLSCLNCDRERILKTRKKKSLSKADMESIADLLNKLEVEQVCFFNLGEPFMSNNVTKEIQILRKKNQKTRIVTSTNGYYLDSSDKRKAALLLDHIYFSIDGCDQETISKYQVRGDFERSYNNLKLLVSERKSENIFRTVIEWKYVLFRWNDHPSHINKAISLAKEANVDIISFWPGGANIQNQSFRYKYHPFYRNLGTKCWKGREIDFRKSFESSFPPGSYPTGVAESS